MLKHASTVYLIYEHAVYNNPMFKLFLAYGNKYFLSFVKNNLSYEFSIIYVEN